MTKLFLVSALLSLSTPPAPAKAPAPVAEKAKEATQESAVAPVGNPVPAPQAAAPQPPPQIYKQDWILLVLGQDGTPVRCWELPETELVAQDGWVLWRDIKSGSVIRISGSYVSVQVPNKKWDEAFAYMGMERNVCPAVWKTGVKPRK